MLLLIGGVDQRISRVLVKILIDLSLECQASVGPVPAIVSWVSVEE